MANISDRAATKRKIVEVLTSAGPGQLAADYDGGPTVLVTYGDPPPEVGDPDEIVIVGRITGSQETATIGQSATGRDDNYTIEMFIGVARQGSDCEAVDARCQEIIDSIGATLFASPRLNRSGTEPALMDAVYPGRLEGPNSSPTDGSAVVSGAFLDVEVRAALRGS